MSRRVKIPTWKVASVDLDELDNTQMPEKPQDAANINTAPTRTAEVDYQDAKNSTTKAKKLAGGSYTNLAFVPEIEVTTPENTPLPQTEDVIETSNEDILKQEDRIYPQLSHSTKDEGSPKSIRSVQSRRNDFV